MVKRALSCAWMAVLVLAAGTAAQDSNISEPPSVIEDRLMNQPIQILGMQDNRFAGDRTQRVALRYRDSVVVGVKWARAAEGGWALNNQPRYERAAYELQKLFLDPGDYVVPPTVIRIVPLRVYTQIDPETKPTFEGAQSVLVVLQYWLNNVEVHDSIWSPDRFHTDPAYAYAFANLNVLTYLIRHADSNPGNILISSDGSRPRVFAVDNGVAFSSPDSPRGTKWKDLLVDGLPRQTVDRLRTITRAELDSTLAVVDQFEVQNDRLVRVQPTAKMTPHIGVEFDGTTAQFGLTSSEIDGVWDRLQQLLQRVDAGELDVF